MTDSEGLLKWVQTFDSEQARSVTDLESLCDGVVLVEIYKEITQDDKETWSVEQGSSWLIVVKDLKKLVRKMEDFFLESLGTSIDLAHIDVTGIARHHHEDEVAKVLEVMAKMAVECPEKELYIKRILSLDQEYQGVLMHAISGIENRYRSQQDLDDGPNDETTDLQTPEPSGSESDALKEMINDLEVQVKRLEKDNALLKEEIEHATSKGEAVNKSQEAMLEKQVTKLKEDLAKASRESQTKLGLAEDKNSDLQAEIRKLQAVMEETTKSSDETIRRLEENVKFQADELDVSRAKAAQLSKLESKIQKYQERIEEIPELKSQLQALEEKNSEYMHKFLDQEASLELKETLEKQVADLRDKVVDLEAQLSAANAVSQVRQKEAEKGREALELVPNLERSCHELRQQLEHANDEIMELKASMEHDGGVQANTSLSSQLDGESKEKLTRLERENAKLKSQVDMDLAGKLEEALKLKDRFEKDAREAMQRKTELETKLLQSSTTQKSEGEALANNLQQTNIELREKNATLEAELESLKSAQNTSNEIAERDAANEAVSEKLIAKLKEKEAECDKLSLHKEKLEAYVRKSLSVTQSKYKSSLNALKTKVKELEEENKAERQVRKQDKSAHEREARLMMSSFYEVGLDIQRRLAFPSASKSNASKSPPHHQPTSWLGKGRSSVPK